jgi:formate hydrogenlyase transcriptional activator
MSQPADDLSILRDLAEGTARVTGEDFLRTLARKLAEAMGTRCALVAEFLGGKIVRSLAYWKFDHFVDTLQWDITGTPCEDVIEGSLCHHPMGVAEKFPLDGALVDMKIQSYLGVPLVDDSKRVLGHLCVFDDRPMPQEPRALAVFRIFAARALAELERLRFEKMLTESERRYRDLYDEAPIAYIYEDLESKFVRANRAACNLLGIKPEEVTSIYGKDLLADTPEVHETIRRALEAMKTEGKAFAGVELELRRHDDGRPVWVQWWSKPEPDGRHTRTMIVDITERVLMEREKARLEQQNLYLQEEIKQVHNFEEIVGNSPALTAVLDQIRRVAPTDSSVLIFGETGTGKELIARAIHSNSGRRDKPLIKVNCAALPAGLVESELFGHERGAFSGAITKRVGRFELASGGTIFLDEIGELPLETQAKLLRVLQEREFERVGGSQSIKVDVRIIAATNRNLARAVQEGTFRQDLFYRLNVFPVTLPPLRERVDDIPLLVQFMVDKFATRIGRKFTGIGRATMDRLQAYPWPGNVRELENVLERAVILSPDKALEVGADLLGELHSADREAGARPDSQQASGDRTIQGREKAHILAVLNETKWTIEGECGAAKILGLHPNTLRSRLKKLGLSRSSS